MESKEGHAIGVLWDHFIGESKNVEVDGPNGSWEVFLHKLTRTGDFPC